MGSQTEKDEFPSFDLEFLKSQKLQFLVNLGPGNAVLKYVLQIVSDVYVVFLGDRVFAGKAPMAPKHVRMLSSQNRVQFVDFLVEFSMMSRKNLSEPNAVYTLTL